MFEALAAIAIVALMLVPGLNIVVGLLAGVALGGVIGGIIGLVAGIGLTVAMS